MKKKLFLIIFLTINCCFLYSQVNLIPNWSFEDAQVGRVPRCPTYYSSQPSNFQAHQCGIDEDIDIWRNAKWNCNCSCNYLHLNKSCPSPDWMDIAICGNSPYANNLSAVATNPSSNRYIRIGGDGDQKPIYREGVRTTISHSLYANKTYFLRLNLARIKTGNNTLKVYMSNNGDCWNDDNAIKQKVAQFDLSNNYNNREFYSFETIFTIDNDKDNEMNNIVFLAYDGLMLLDDVELYELDCFESLYIENKTYTTTDPIYEAEPYIMAGYEVANPPYGSGNVTVKSGADIKYRAGESITLEPGFEAEYGSEFLAWIEPCIPWDRPQNAEFNSCVSLGNNCVQIGGSYTPSYNYSWTPITGLNDPNIPNPTTCLPTTGFGSITYTLIVSDNSGNQIGSDYKTIIHYWPISTGSPGAQVSNIPSPTSILNYWDCDFTLDYNTEIVKIDISDNSNNIIKEYTLNAGTDFFSTLPNIPYHFTTSPDIFTSGIYSINIYFKDFCNDQWGASGAWTFNHQIGGKLSMDSTYSINEPIIFDNFLLYSKYIDSLISPLKSIFYDSLTYKWNFGDSTTSNLKFPEKSFRDAGDYIISLEITDSIHFYDSISQNFHIITDQNIIGSLTENPSCGGAVISGDTLTFMTGGVIVPDSIYTPIATDINGGFIFNSDGFENLNDTALYSIVSKSGMVLQDTTHKTIQQWISESPLNLYYTTTVNEEWVARYNGADSLNDGATAIDLMGNIYVAGASTSATNGYDMTTIKYDSTGTQLWAETYNGAGNGDDAARAITVDSSGNVYITGESKGSDNKTIITTISYTNSGTQRWLQRYSNASCTGSSATCIAQDHAGNIIVGGTSSCTSSSNLYTVLKYNNTGNLIWDSYYSGSLTVSDNTLKALSVDDSNNVYVSGISLGSGTAYDMTTVKFSSGGTQLWADSYDNPNHTNDYVYSNAINNDGKIVVSGYSHRSSGNDEAVVINYTPGGIRNWVSIYNNDAHDFAYKVLCNSSDDIYIAGNSGITSSLTMLALKYDAAGNLSWDKHTLPSSTYNFKSAAIDIADNLYIAGTTQTSVGGKYITTQKLNSESDVQWTKIYNVSTHINDFPSQIKISQNGNVYISGYSLADSTAYDFITLKYSQCPLTAANLKTNNTGAGQNTINSVKENSFIQIIPNPNNGNMQVSYEIPENTNGTFEVYNLMGEKLFSYSLFSGKNTFSIFRSELEQGIYFYRAIAGNRQIASDKIVIIK